MHEISEYKGNRILILKKNEEDKFGFRFGLSKAKLIMENLDTIQDFIDSSEQ